jgi:four helix bundle protein
MAIRTFRDLVAWQKAMELARMVYRVTQAMPSSEQFGLTNQMRRAAYSIPSNIAEGYARQSRPDYLKFLRISRGSLAELSTQMELATTLGMIPPNRPVQLLLEEADRVVQFLIMSLERKTREESAAKAKKRPNPIT